VRAHEGSWPFVAIGTALGLTVLIGSGLPGGASAAEPAAGPTVIARPASDDSTAMPFDLNSATRAQIRSLPIPAAVAEAIYQHRTYRSYFTSLFDLLEVEGMTPELLERVRPLVAISPTFQRERLERDVGEQRVSELNYVVQRFLAEEGASEGLVDEYIDQIKDPRNVNRLDYFDLLSYQNVSPVDAVAILKERELAGRIESLRQMRGSPGLSYWGYRNLRDFVAYEEGAPRLHADYQLRVYDTPYPLDDSDILNESIVQSATVRNFDLNTYAGRLQIGTTDPYATSKLRLRYGSHFKAGVLTHRNLGEDSWSETLKGFASIENLGARKTGLGTARLHSLVLGNYTVAFGLGLLMDATDFYMPRRTGYGYSVRSIGVRGDASRGDEFALRGGALEGSLGRVRGTLFYSQDDKDAVLNPDGSFNRYISMAPRLSNDLLADIRSDIDAGLLPGGNRSAFLPMRDVMDERVLGANFKVELRPGTYVGLTGIEIRTRNNAFDTPVADRWNPRDTTLIARLDKTDDRDSEIRAAYNSVHLGDYRRLWGAEAQGVYRNLAVAGEYGKLETSAKPDALGRIFSAGPEAFIAQASLQYENLNVLALYRDYDLGYDNPYNRAFSEDARYEQTLLDGNAFYLNNPYWAQLALNLPQSKSERGWYFNARYQFSRQFTITDLTYDTWTRAADGADMKRAIVRAEYRPIYPVRLRVRHSRSSRHATRPDDVRNFTSWDTRFEMLTNLSSFDQLHFLFSTTNVMFPSRPRLSAAAAGGDTRASTLGVAGEPGRALQGAFTHNFNRHLAITLSSQIYEGFLYNYEDNEFVLVDGKGFRNWLLLRSKVSDRLACRVKWTHDRQQSHTYLDVRDFGNLIPPTPDATLAPAAYSSFRFQLDFSL
jgi:DNA uptake protein ComE-like DNA-binding protein